MWNRSMIWLHVVANEAPGGCCPAGRCAWTESTVRVENHVPIWEVIKSESWNI